MRRGEPATAETADFAEFPSFTAFRSDLAMLARQLLEVDGTKKLGQRLMSVADDVTEAYLEFAKANLDRVSQFGRGDALAEFSNKEDAEQAIRRSGLTGKAMVLPVKRGQNRVILSPSEAINRGIWQGDGDKRITLKSDFGAELVEAIGRRGSQQNKLTVPWQFQTAYDRRKALSRMGIETPSEFRSALREFIALQERAVANKVRELELSMVGRKNDGLDFFPTPAEIADQMVEAAEIGPDMAVLEPSAGMGHLADRIRAAGAEPEVIEVSGERRELLLEKGYYLTEYNDFMQMEPRRFFTYGDVFRAPDGTEGIMRGVGSMGSQRVRLEDEAGNRLGLYDRDELTGMAHRGTQSGYDRIIMNPPFSNRRDAEHVRHAFDLLRPGGRIVAIMGEGVFFGQDKKAQEFRDWLESVGGTSEKLPEGSFMDPSLPVNTAVNARMVVIDKPDRGNGPLYSRSQSTREDYEARIDALFAGNAANRVGVTVLDRSDVLEMLGLGANPMTLVESKVIKGLDNHPAMSADVWKKIPDWIENPAAVFRSDTEGGRLVFIAPEMVNGSSVRVIVEPDPTVGGKRLNVSLLINAYDAPGASPFMRWMNDGLLDYVDTKKFPAIFTQSVGRQLPDTALRNKPGTRKILTEKNLAGYRKTLMSAGPSVGNMSTVSDIRAALLQAFPNKGQRLLDSGNVAIVQSEDDVPSSAEPVQTPGRDGAPQAFFDRTTNKAYLVADGLTPADVYPVMQHEATHWLEHNDPQLMNPLLDRLQTMLKRDTQAKWLQDAQAAVPASTPRADVLSEVAAYAVTHRAKAPANLKKWIQDVVAGIRVGLMRMGWTPEQITDADLAAVARHAVKRMTKTQDQANQPQRKSDAQRQYARANPQPTTLTLPEQSLLRKLQQHLQDRHERVKQLQDQIIAVTGRGIEERADYRLAETNRPGRIAARLETARVRLFEPLVKRLSQAGHSLEDLEQLLHAMHATERYERLVKLGGNENKAAEELAGMSLVEASQIRVKFQNAPELHAIAEQARKVAKMALELRLRYGLTTPDAVEAMNKAYQYYVPLKGDNEYGPRIKRATGHGERQEHILQNIFRDFELVVMAGEKNLARQHLLELALQNPDADLWTVDILPKGRSVTPSALYRVKYHGSVIGEFRTLAEAQAYVDGESGMRKYATGYSIEGEHGERVHEYVKPLQDHEIPVYVNGELVRIQVKDEALARQLRPLDGKQSWEIVKALRGLMHYLKSIYTAYSPTFMLTNPLRDLSTGLINMLGNQGAATAAKAYANYLPAFGAMLRYAWAKQDHGGRMGDYLREYRLHGGKTGASWMSDLEQQSRAINSAFEDAQGALRLLIQRKPFKAARVAGSKTLGVLAHPVEVINQATENALRLALFAALRDQGASPAKAAQAAKLVTVDFDRKGDMSGGIGLWFMFFNPAAQGTANMAHNLSKGQHKAQAWAGLAGVVGIGALMVASYLADPEDEDRWFGLTRNAGGVKILIRLGEHTISLPFSQEYAPFLVLGASLAEVIMGKQTHAQAAVRVLQSMLDAWIPIRNAINLESDEPLKDSIIGLAPSLAQPLMQIGLNRNSFGSELYPESDFDKGKPDNLKLFRNTKGTLFDQAAQGIARAGEGLGSKRYENDWSKVSPETLKHLWRTYTGGLGTFATDAVSAAALGAQDPATLESNDIPVLKSFVRADELRPISSRFYDIKREVDAAKAQFDQARKAGDSEGMQTLREDTQLRTLRSLAKPFDTTHKAVKKLKDRADLIKQDDTLSVPEKRARLKGLEQDQERRMRMALNAWRERMQDLREE